MLFFNRTHEARCLLYVKRFEYRCSWLFLVSQVLPEVLVECIGYVGICFIALPVNSASADVIKNLRLNIVVSILESTSTNFYAAARFTIFS